MTCSDRPHDEAMVEALRADPIYAAELRALLKAEVATDELAILDRQLAYASVQGVGDRKSQLSKD
jgi:hypothetical protein